MVTLYLCQPLEVVIVTGLHVVQLGITSRSFVLSESYSGNYKSN